MRFANKPSLVALVAAAMVAVAIPALGQDAPKSILPPGFGEPEPEPKSPDTANDEKPTDLLPTLPLDARTTITPPPVSSADPLSPISTERAAGTEELTPPPELQDLPPSARRSTALVGIIEPGEGDLGTDAFGQSNGIYLSFLMRKLNAPITSRWASILLRRALLTKAYTPRGVNGADWVGERAWLLLRMGEADAARILAQSVDVDQYTPKLFQVAMQASLASADPSGLCPLVEPASQISDERSWAAARAICSALAGESVLASSQMDRVRAKGLGRGIDGLLAEKVVGAGGNTRRAVVIEWEDVSQLTAWRYGMATATGIKIPESLMATVGPHVRAWQARAPLLALQDRTPSVEIAAALGVFSNSALVDHYGAVAEAGDVGEARGTIYLQLRTAYVASSTQAKLDAMRSLWNSADRSPFGQYSRLILTARAAARLTPDSAAAPEADLLLASMMSAGLDVQAARWAKLVSQARGSSGMRAWGLLAVGSPGKVVDWTPTQIRNYRSDAGTENERRGQFLFAAMAGLGRIDADVAASMADDFSVPIERTSRWTVALERAVLAREPGTVALLCAVGLQEAEWKALPAVQLYHIVSALRRVGLASEARMIAAEALSRS
jgi:hypothetical protein